MNYKLLTIGNITKLCDDSIILDENGNISDLQWFDFQLQWLLKQLDLDIFDKNLQKWQNYENTLLTRNQIFRLLKDNFLFDETNRRVIIDQNNISHISISSLIKYGMYKDPSCNHFFNPDFKLKKNFILQLNKNRTEIDTQDVKDFYIENPDSLLTEVEYKRNVVKSKKYMEKKIVKKKELPKLGIFNWKNNSCYADSIIYILLVRMIQDKQSYLYKHMNDFKYNEQNLTKDKYFCGKTIETDSGKRFITDTTTTTISKLNNILQSFKNIISEIESGKNIIIPDTLFKDMYKCGNTDSTVWSSGNTEATDEFFLYLLDILNYSIPERIRYQENNSNTNKIKVYWFKKDNPHINKILDTLKTDTDFEFNLDTTDAEGKNMYDFYRLYEPEVHKPIQILNVSNFNLLQFYNNISVQESEPSSIVKDKSNYFIHPLLNKIYHKSDIEKVMIEINNLEIEISRLLTIKETTLNRNPLYPLYLIKNEDIYDSNSTHYFLKEDADDESKHILLQDIPEDIGFRYSVMINEFNLSHDTEKYINLKILPTESIMIEGAEFKFSGLVYWKNNHYMSFYKYDNKYYHYNDIGTDNIIEFKSYEEMLKFDKNIILTNSSILHYIKSI